jgi:type I restriction enzyme R subunit
VGFVNGLPLLLAEWKAPTCPLADAYEANLRDYRDTVPRLFDANGFVLLSNGLEAVMGASHAAFDYFAPWKRLEEGTRRTFGTPRSSRSGTSCCGGMRVDAARFRQVW